MKKGYFLKLSLSLGLLALSALMLHWAGAAHETLHLPAGTDPVLTRLPLVDATPLLSWGWLLFNAAALAAACAYERPRLPYLIATVALFAAIRNVFIVITPVGPPLGLIKLYNGDFLSPLRGSIFSDEELFFSGHTGLPFLYYLMFRRPPGFREFCLFFSCLMAVAVLLTRNHYAIDALGAFFTTYSIHALSLRLFEAKA